MLATALVNDLDGIDLLPGQAPHRNPRPFGRISLDGRARPEPGVLSEDRGCGVTAGSAKHCSGCQQAGTGEFADNSSPAYANYVSQQTGIGLGQPLTSSVLSGPQGISLAKAMSQWETGSAFPLTDSQWATAQAAGLSGVPATGGGAATSTAGAGAATSTAGAGGGTPGITDWIADYFLRATVIILGFIFVNSGLHMFGAGVPLAEGAGRLMPAKRQRVRHSGSVTSAVSGSVTAVASAGQARREERQGLMLRHIARRSLPKASTPKVKGAGPKVLGNAGVLRVKSPVIEHKTKPSKGRSKK